MGLGEWLTDTGYGGGWKFRIDGVYYRQVVFLLLGLDLDLDLDIDY